jgi:hypothetical protein
MSKFLLNLLVEFLKVLPKSKFIWISKIKSRLNFLLGSSPASPTSLEPAHFTPPAIVSVLNPFGLSNLGVFAKKHLSFEFAHSSNEAFSLSHVTAMRDRPSTSSPSLRQVIPVTSSPLLATPGPLRRPTSLLALIKRQFHAPTYQVNVWNNHVFALSTNLVLWF